MTLIALTCCTVCNTVLHDLISSGCVRASLGGTVADTVAEVRVATEAGGIIAGGAAQVAGFAEHAVDAGLLHQH